MSTALQQLDFVISLVDRVSGPAGKIMKTMDQVTTNVQAGYRKIGYGAAGLFGAGYALDRLVEPAKELRTALGTIQSLGVEKGALDDLRTTAQNTASKYGQSAAEIISKSYNLQSAIRGLEGNELSMLANRSTLLATATKGSIDATTSYVGQIFNLQSKQVEIMGKTAFMETLVGKTAKAVELFNTNGEKMSEAMKNIGKQATSMNVPLSEQLAVMGFLQNTMIEGGRSGNAYLSFLSNVSKAEEVLGLQLTNDKNEALPIVEMIGRIEEKFGAISKAGDQRLLQKAFGKRGQQVLSAMAGELDSFNESLKEIDSITSMDNAITMANAITDSWDQASSAVRNVQANFSERILKYLIPVYDQVTLISDKMLRWMGLFPHLTDLVAGTTLGIFAIIAAISALSIAVGVSKFLLVGWTAAVAILKFVLGPIPYLFGIARLGMSMWMVQMSLGKGVIASTTAALRVMMVTMKLNTLQTKFGTAVMFVWKTAALVATGAMKALNLAMKMNPISLIVIGVAALAYGLYKLADHFGVFDALKDKVKNLKAWFDSFNLVESLLNGVDWLIDKINLIPGINIGNSDAAAPSIAVPSSTRESYQPRVRGGVINRISQANNTNSQSMGDVIVNNYGDRMDGFDLREQLAMGG